MSNPVVHFEIVGQDGPATQRFYGDLFGWAINADNEYNYGLTDPGKGMMDHGIAGGITGTADGAPARTTIYIEVDDIEATLARAEELGGRKVFGPETIMDRLTLAQFTDPDGNIIGLLSPAAG
jgi:uncharacterized protein